MTSRSSRSVKSTTSPTASPTPKWQTPPTGSPLQPESSRGSSCSSEGNVRRQVTIDHALVIPVDQDSGFLLPYTQTLPIPHLTPSVHEPQHAPNAGTVTWCSIPGSEFENTSVAKSPLLSDGFVRIAVNIDFNCRLELRVFSTSERGKPIITRYVESIDGLDVRISYAELFPLINETFSPLELLFSLTITWVSDLLSSVAEGSQQIYETSSPASIEALGGFLDQPGGHDIVFCFPKGGQQLYGDRYILQRASSRFRNLLCCSTDRERTKLGHGKSSALAEDSDDEDWEEKLRAQNQMHGPITPMPVPEEDTCDKELGIDDDSCRRRTQSPTGSDRTAASPDYDAGRPPVRHSHTYPSPVSQLSIQEPLTRRKSISNNNSPADPKFDHRLEESKEAPPYNDSVYVMWITDTSYRTFRAMLYYLYTNFIAFAPLTSSFRQSNSPSVVSRRSSITVLSNIGQQRHLAREVIVNEYISRYPNRPAPVSPKSVYAVAQKYDLPALEAQAMSRIHCAMTPPLAVTELFSAFSRTYEPVRMAQLAHVIASWKDVVRSPEWNSVKERGKAQPDVYFTQMLCEILERLPSGSSIQRR